MLPFPPVFAWINGSKFHHSFVPMLKNRPRINSFSNQPCRMIRRHFFTRPNAKHNFPLCGLSFGTFPTKSSSTHQPLDPCSHPTPKELGDTAKRRFQEFAANWSDPRRQSNASSFSRQSQARGNERRGLLSGELNLEEEEEMDFVAGSGRGGGELVELGDVRGGGGASKKKD